MAPFPALSVSGTSSRTSPSKEAVIRNGQQANGSVTAVQNSVIPVTQAPNDTLSREGRFGGEHWNVARSLGPRSPVNVSVDGIPCILFWARRITLKFKNQTWLEFASDAFGQRVTVDTNNSNCSEQSATLSLKLGDAESLAGLAIRFVLTSDNKVPVQSWFSLYQVQIIFNNSVCATFNATGVYAPRSYSYHCHLVSSLQGADALLLPRDPGHLPSLWEVAFTDFQIQAFGIQGAQFAKARDCAPSFSPAVLMGLATSLILLLVLAYALHMLAYLRALDRHYECLASPARFPVPNACEASEEKELLQGQDAECYELRSRDVYD